MARIVIIGAGVVGLLSAYALAKRGAAVTVIDRASGPAEGCSHANAGILAVGHANAWAGPSAVGAILRALAGCEAGVRVTKLLDPALWCWGARFLGQCTAAAHARNTDKLQRLSRMIRELTREVEADLGLTGTLRHEGGLYLFRDAGQFAEHAASVGADGQMSVLTGNALTLREPALAHMSNRLAGGIFSPFDSVGDCHLFTRAVAQALAERYDVEFRFETSVMGFERKGRTITAIATDQGTIAAEKILLATGTATPRLTRPLGFAPAIYPVKGYSGTWKIRDPARIPRLPFVDETELLAVASYDGRLRVTAIAEFAGQNDLTLPENRLALLRDYVALPSATRSTKAVPRSGPGCAPAQPPGRPISGGCGTWTTCGSMPATASLAGPWRQAAVKSSRGR